MTKNHGYTESIRPNVKAYFKHLRVQLDCAEYRHSQFITVKLDIRKSADDLRAEVLGAVGLMLDKIRILEP